MNKLPSTPAEGVAPTASKNPRSSSASIPAREAAPGQTADASPVGPRPPGSEPTLDRRRRARLTRPRANCQSCGRLKPHDLDDGHSWLAEIPKRNPQTARLPPRVAADADIGERPTRRLRDGGWALGHGYSLETTQEKLPCKCVCDAYTNARNLHGSSDSISVGLSPALICDSWRRAHDARQAGRLLAL
jgi:hypothetical protein